jgi:hypothetical protein
MEVEYDLTRDDLFAFQWRAAYDSPRGRRTRRKLYAGWLVAVLLFVFVPAIGPHGIEIARVSWLFLIIAFATIILFQIVMERWLMRRAIRGLVRDEKPEKGQLGRHTVVLSETELVERTAVGEQRTSWAGVDRVEENPDYIFIYTTAAAAHLIPKRAFRDRQTAERFYQFSKARKEAAR